MGVKTDQGPAVSPGTPPVSPRDQVMAMITGYWVSQICGTAARPGLADQLAAGPATIPELAAATSADPDGLGRLVRAGATIGLFAEADGDRFSLTPLGAELRDDEAAGSLRDRAIALTSPGHWLPWGRLFDAVVSGERQDRAALGMDVWAYYARYLKEGAHFARTMSSISAEASRAVLGCYDVARFRRIVDVGGSRGVLLTGPGRRAAGQGRAVRPPEVAEGARGWHKEPDRTAMSSPPTSTPGSSSRSPPHPASGPP